MGWVFLRGTVYVPDRYLYGLRDTYIYGYGYMYVLYKGRNKSQNTYGAYVAYSGR